MPHVYAGQNIKTYRPSATRRPSKLSPVSETPRVRSAPRNLGWNYGPSNLLALLTYNPHARHTLARTGGNVPSLGIARDRANLQRIINSARSKYQNATTNANRITIYKKFTKNHAAALNALKRAHIKMLSELNAAILNSTSPNTRLTRSLQSTVNALKANLRKR
jgi:hypothetical protein